MSCCGSVRGPGTEGRSVVGGGDSAGLLASGLWSFVSVIALFLQILSGEALRVFDDPIGVQLGKRRSWITACCRCSWLQWPILGVPHLLLLRSSSYPMVDCGQARPGLDTGWNLRSRQADR